MARTVEDWAHRLESRPTKTVTQLGLLVIGVVAIFVIAIWGITTGFSYWWGQGDAYQQQNSAQNWIAAQRAFHKENQDVQADVQKIADAKRAITAYEDQHPEVGNGTPYDPTAQEDANLHSTLTGLQQNCQNTVAEYNTDAESYLTEDWRDADLPSQLDLSICT
jgi:hypothetical protein